MSRYTPLFIALAVSLLLVSGYTSSIGSKPSVNPAQSMANVSLQAKLNGAVEADPRNAGIDVSVYYRDTLSRSNVVFDLQDITGTCSRLDVFRLFLDFADRMQDERLDTVELAYQGEVKFKISGDYFNTLGVERDFQNPTYTIRTFPENLHTADGLKAYGAWTGGILAVLSEQMEDFNDFHDKWYLDDLLSRSRY